MDQLQLTAPGLDGVFPLAPYDHNAYYDLDRGAVSLVSYYTRDRRGTAYPDPDMTWEPKETFGAVADYFAQP